MLYATKWRLCGTESKHVSQLAFDLATARPSPLRTTSTYRVHHHETGEIVKVTQNIEIWVIWE